MLIEPRGDEANEQATNGVGTTDLAGLWYEYERVNGDSGGFDGGVDTPC